MASALNIAQTGLDAQQTRLAVIANNLANVATTGFKKSRPVFEDLLYETVAQPGAASSQSTELPSGLMLGTGVRTVATSKVFTQGESNHSRGWFPCFDHPSDRATSELEVTMPVDWVSVAAGVSGSVLRGTSCVWTR